MASKLGMVACGNGETEVRENSAMPAPIAIESNISLRPYNSFGLPALAERLVRVRDEADVQAVLDEFETFGAHPADDRTLLILRI